MSERPGLPLAGVRVVDLTSTLSGPYATLLLADAGAEVIKVESPAGDTSRDLGPRAHPDMAAVFLNLNRAKRGVVLDLHTDDGRRRLKQLADSADAVVHNLRPDAARACGADAPALRDGHQQLVHCAISGYGSEGPYRDQPAYDDTIQAVAGIAAQQEWMAGEPQFVATAIADKVTGLTAAFAVTAALHQRAATGEGCAIEVPMFETIAAFGLLEHLWGRTFVPPRGDARYPRTTSPERRPYPTADGWIAVVVYTHAHWRRFFDLIGRADLASDERFATLEGRTRHHDELVGVIAGALREATTAEWIERLTAARIPVSKYNRVDDLFDDPQLLASHFFHRAEHPTEGPLLQVPTPISFDGRRAELGSGAPLLGADTAAVFAELDGEP